MQLLRNGVDKLTVTADYGNKSNSNAFVFKVFFQYEDGTVDASSNVSVPTSGTNTATRQSSGDKKVIGFAIGTTAGAGNRNGCIRNVMVSADGLTEYVAPQATTYPITFPSEAGTVYGGTLTVNQDGSAGLAAEWANIASYAGETLPGEWISDRDVYAPGTTPTIGAQVVYKLAAPLTYTLTAAEMTTLFGQNNWWADCGDIAEINYRCDTAKYIDKKLAALLAALS